MQLTESLPTNIYTYLCRALHPMPCLGCVFYVCYTSHTCRCAQTLPEGAVWLCAILSQEASTQLSKGAYS